MIRAWNPFVNLLVRWNVGGTAVVSTFDKNDVTDDSTLCWKLDNKIDKSHLGYEEYLCCLIIVSISPHKYPLRVPRKPRYHQVSKSMHHVIQNQYKLLWILHFVWGTGEFCYGDGYSFQVLPSISYNLLLSVLKS